MSEFPKYASRAVVNWFERHTLGLLRLIYHNRPGDMADAVTRSVEEVPYLDLSPDQLYVAQRTALALCATVDHFDAWQRGFFAPDYIYGYWRADIDHTGQGNTDRVFGLKIEQGRYASKIFDMKSKFPGYALESPPTSLFTVRQTPAPSTLEAEISAHVDAQDIHRAIGRYVDMENIDLLVQRTDAVTLHDEEVRKASRGVTEKFLHTFVGSPYKTWLLPHNQFKLFPGISNIWSAMAAGDLAILGPLEFYYLRRLFYSMLLTTFLVEAWRKKDVENYTLPAPDSMLWGYVDGTLEMEWHETGAARARTVSPAHPEYFIAEDGERVVQWKHAVDRVAAVNSKIKRNRDIGLEDKLAENRIGEMQFNWHISRLNGMISQTTPMPEVRKIVRMRQAARWQKKRQKKGRA